MSEHNLPYKKHSILFAPMEGITDPAYRKTVMELYPEWDMFATDFLRVPTEGYVTEKKVIEHFGEEIYNDTKLRDKTTYQILTTPRANTEQTLEVINSLEFKHLDLNIGCPSRRVNAHQGGSFLLTDVKLLEEVVSLIRKKTNKTFNACDKDREAAMIMNKIFITVYQKTKNSSFSTKDSADKLSHFIGSKHYEWDINTDVESIVSKISDNTKIKYNWDEHNLSLQNIQARVRSPFIWFIANSNDFLLLATSNRSELSVGYSTMDGDSSGSIAPIAGIDKIFIKRFLKYLKEKNDYRVLDYVLKLNPSAELKPLKYNQKDEDELMPYSLLTEIEYLAVKKRLSPKEILDKINGYDRKVILEGVKKFFTNYGKSQWKRERSAPSFHFDEYSLDSSLWNRMPILSNNFQEEIDFL